VIVHGRITVFGEYLMHDLTDGYVLPTRQALATWDDSDLPIHPSYDYRVDRVRQMLSQLGMPTCDKVRGTLPLGHGFAGSTALIALHLGSGSQPITEVLASKIDREIHGFDPSGVDYWSVNAQAPGFFGPAGWRSAPKAEKFAASALLLPEARPWPLSETRDRIRSIANRLAPIARHLCAVLRAQKNLDYQALFDYAVELSRAHVYGPRAATMVDHLVQRRLAVKGIGGLTNKAIVIVWPAEMSMPERLSMLAELEQCGPDGVLTQL
jgi:hypothetical protein